MGAVAAFEPGAGLAEKFAAVAGGAPQVVLEASGAPAAMASALDIAGFEARVVFVGIDTGGSAETKLGQIQSKSLTRAASSARPTSGRRRCASSPATGIDLAPVVTARFPLAEATEALDAAQQTDSNVKVQMVNE